MVGIASGGHTCWLPLTKELGIATDISEPGALNPTYHSRGNRNCMIKLKYPAGWQGYLRKYRYTIPTQLYFVSPTGILGLSRNLVKTSKVIAQKNTQRKPKRIIVFFLSSFVKLDFHILVGNDIKSFIFQYPVSLIYVYI